MNKQNDTTHNILQIVLDIIKKASDEVLSFYEDISAEKAYYKSDASPLTHADLASNEIIVSGLQQHFPYSILTEEGRDNLKRLQDKKIWIVDPLDGTKEFISKSGEFTINIALVENNRPILGIVAVPVQQVIFYSALGKGSFLIKDGIHTKIHCSKISNFEKARLSFSRSHLHPQLKQLLDKYQLNNLIPKGSALKYCSIAEGSSDASLRKTPLMEWDICASDCILTEAGGRLTDFAGREFTYNKPKLKFEDGIIASNDLLHNKLLSIIADL